MTITYVKENLYSDINLDVGVNVKPLVVTGDSALLNTIMVILRTIPRTRCFRPTFGSRVWYLLQQPASSLNALRLKIMIKSDIEQWQPYVKVDLSNTKVTPFAGGDGYNVLISCSNQLLGTSTSSVLSLQRRNVNAV